MRNQELFSKDEVISLCILAGNVVRLASNEVWEVAILPQVTDAGRHLGDLYVEISFSDQEVARDVRENLEASGYSVRERFDMANPETAFALIVRG